MEEGWVVLGLGGGRVVVVIGRKLGYGIESKLRIKMHSNRDYRSAL